MKKILITFAATSALYAAVAFSLLHWQFYYLVSAENMQSLAAQFERVYNAGFQAFEALQECKKQIGT